MQRSENPPRHLVCSISKQVYLNPVTVYPSGHVYEKEMIDKLIADAIENGKKPLCPLSRMPIENYATAWAIRSAVEDYLHDHPSASDEQYQLIQADKPDTTANITPAAAAQSASTTVRVGEDLPSPVSRPSALPEISQLLESYPDIYQQLDYSQQTEAFLRAERAREEHARLESERIAERARVEEERAEHVRSQQEIARMLEQLNSTAYAMPVHDDAAEPVRDVNADLTNQEKKERDTLVNDIQDLIYALKFEVGPKPKGKIDNFSLLFFAMIENMFLEPLPWQKIQVNEGPKSPAMYEVLKAAMRALKEVDRTILNNAKQHFDGQYDRVKTILGGQVSLGGGGYATFAKFMGTIKNQPGYLVDQILLRVNHMLMDLHNKHPAQPVQSMQRRFGT